MPRTKIIFLCILLSVLMIIALLFGSTELNMAALWHGIDDPSHHILWQIRMPRVVLAVLIGFHFAIAGAILQTVTRNALADPGILGISGGAILAMTFFVLFEILVAAASIEAYMLPLQYLPIAALSGAVIGASCVFMLSWKRGLSPRRFVLIGIAVGSFFQAIALGLVFGWGPTQSDLLWIWISGSLYGGTWEAVQFVTPWTILTTICLALCFRQITMLRIDDNSGISRGFLVQKWRLIALLLACVYTGTAVGVVGPVGFVGLVVPHISRRFFRHQLKWQFIATAVIGAILTVSADAFGRYVFTPAEIPVGVLTSLIGAPFLFWLLFPMPFLRKKRSLSHVHH